MRSHIVLSMFKVAAAEANVPEPPDSGAISRHHPNILFYTVFLTFTFHRFFSGLCSFSSYLWFALNLAATKRQWNNCVVMMKLNDWKNILNLNFGMTVRRVISSIDTEVWIVANVLLMLNFYRSDIFFCNTKQICKTIWRIPVRWWPVHILLWFKLFELSFFNLTFLPSTILI